jgi:hypothetical protein
MSRLLAGTRHALAISLLAPVLTTSTHAQERRPAENQRSHPHTGPWNSDLLLFSSVDGENFDRPRTFVERAGVPCVIRATNDRLIAVFQWFPFHRREAFDRVAVVFSENNGATWNQPEPIVMEGLPERAQRPFDPTLVALEDGKLRLYFTCTTPDRPLQGIYSAISEDGRTYRFEPGLRFAVEGEKVVDAAVARLGKTWHLYSPIEPHVFERRARVHAEDPGAPGVGGRPSAVAGGYHAVSEDGLTFRRLDDVSVPVRGSWIGNVLAHDGQLHFYGSGASQGWLARSADGNAWKLATTSLRVGGDPTAVHVESGSFLLIATGPPRRDEQRPPFLPQPALPRVPR